MEPTHDTDPRYRRFNDLRLHHMKLIRWICLRSSGGDPDRCVELMQECYIYLWTHMHLIRPDANYMQQASWVYWHCRSVISHFFRDSQSSNWQTIDPSIADSVPDPGPALDDIATYQREYIYSLSVDLTPREREALDLMLQDYSPKEMASLLHISRSSAITLRHRVIIKLRKRHFDKQPPLG